jgi:hypothetical protein
MQGNGRPNLTVVPRAVAADVVESCGVSIGAMADYQGE